MTSTAMIRCPGCSAVNRVPTEKIQKGLAPVCGRCKAPLPANQPVTVTDATFLAEVEGSSLPVLVDMWAEWCGPCHAIAPVLDQLAVEMAGRLRVAKLNVDENPETSQRFGIRSIPALLVFKDGREVDRIVGVQPKSEIVRRLQQLLN
jgi:thioredoxin 2